MKYPNTLLNLTLLIFSFPASLLFLFPILSPIFFTFLFLFFIIIWHAQLQGPKKIRSKIKVEENERKGNNVNHNYWPKRHITSSIIICQTLNGNRKPPMNWVQIICIFRNINMNFTDNIMFTCLNHIGFVYINRKRLAVRSISYLNTI